MGIIERSLNTAVERSLNRDIDFALKTVAPYVQAMKRNPPYDRDTALSAAMQLFLQQGYHATSLKDLEAALAMRPGSIYAAFDSKENLFLLTLDHYTANQRQLQEQRLADETNALSAMQDHARSIATAWQNGDTTACFLVNTLLEATPDETAIKARAKALMLEIEGMFCTAFQQAIDSGHAKPDLDANALARWYQLQIFGMRVLCSMASDRAEVDAAANAIADAIHGYQIAA